MNISELARKLKVNTEDLREKLPSLGFDVGIKAIKIDDRLASRIIRAWWDEKTRREQKEKYENITKKDESGQVILDKEANIPSVLTVKDFSEILKLPVTIVISELMKNGVMASMNQRIDYDTAAIIAQDLGYKTTEVNLSEEVELDKAKRVSETISAQSEMQSRPPVVVVMGHVDHGKTKLLDSIRKTDVVSGESGGITQHIGAYQVTRKGRKITFIDTPGHEAFTAMRSRGAKVADIAILVVASNEGVKPQTVEALKIAQGSGVPIIVAVNKIDLPDANPDKVKQELSQYNLMSEEWGGKTPFVNISAKMGTNIDEILEQILFITDVNEESIKANDKGEFFGSIIEAHVDKGEGPVATVLVRNGTLKVGDYISIDGVLYGKIRMMKNYKGEIVKEVIPSMPAKILGLKAAPKVGDIIEAVDDPKKARKTKTYRMSQNQDETFIKSKAEETDENNAIDKLNIIIRTDVLGSQEAIIESLKKLESAFFKIKIVSRGLGSVSESDVLNSEATGAILLGFNVLPSASAASLAQEKDVTIKTFKIIYELIDEVKARAKDVIKTERVREDLGKLEVLALFSKSEKGQVFGGKVVEGKIEAGSLVAVLRKEEFITSGKIIKLQVGKEEVKDVEKGQECGLSFEGKSLIEVGDILDIYRERDVDKAL